MEISFRGKSTKLSRKEAVLAAEFFYAIIVPNKRSRRAIRVVIHFTDTMKDDGQTRCMMGHERGRNPKAFCIKIKNKLSRPKQLQTLAHELVHVKQFAKNELRYSEKRQGQTFTEWKRSRVNESKRDYYLWPWEIEAFGMEYGLYKKYTMFLKDSHNLVMTRVKNKT